MIFHQSSHPYNSSLTRSVADLADAEAALYPDLADLDAAAEALEADFAAAALALEADLPMEEEADEALEEAVEAEA